MNKTILIIIGVLALGAVWYFGMNSNATKNSETQKMVAEPTARPTGGTGDTGIATAMEETVKPTGDAMAKESVKEFTVDASNFAFSVKEMKVKKGDTVKITFNNKEGFHDWVVDEFNAASKKLGAGQSDTIEFVADKAGSFEYYCSVGTHRAMGMKGTLTVE